MSSLASSTNPNGISASCRSRLGSRMPYCFTQPVDRLSRDQVPRSAHRDEVSVVIQGSSLARMGRPSACWFHGALVSPRPHESRLAPSVSGPRSPSTTTPHQPGTPDREGDARGASIKEAPLRRHQGTTSATRRRSASRFGGTQAASGSSKTRTVWRPACTCTTSLLAHRRPPGAVAGALWQSESTDR